MQQSSPRISAAKAALSKKNLGHSIDNAVLPSSLGHLLAPLHPQGFIPEMQGKEWSFSFL